VVKLTESEEWTYFNPTTIKISGDFSSKYWPNQIVVITQGGQTKYFEVVSVEVSSGNTLLQIHGGGLYVLSNEEITNHKYSMYAAPRGLPNNFLGTFYRVIYRNHLPLPRMISWWHPVRDHLLKNTCRDKIYSGSWGVRWAVCAALACNCCK